MILYLTLAWLALRILGGVQLWRYRRQIYARWPALGRMDARTPSYAPTVGLRSPQSAALRGLN